MNMETEKELPAPAENKALTISENRLGDFNDIVILLTVVHSESCQHYLLVFAIAEGQPDAPGYIQARTSSHAADASVPSTTASSAQLLHTLAAVVQLLPTRAPVPLAPPVPGARAPVQFAPALPSFVPGAFAPARPFFVLLG